MNRDYCIRLGRRVRLVFVPQNTEDELIRTNYSVIFASAVALLRDQFSVHLIRPAKNVSLARRRN